MAQFICTLCHNFIATVQFDLKKTITLCTKVPLITLLENCSNEKFVMTNYFICGSCYLLLNDLDTYKYKAKTIEEKLERYVSYYYTNIKNEQLEFIVGKSEECSITCEEVDIKEANVLNTNFALDEVSCVSEINSSLKDTHLSSTENLKDKCKFTVEPFQSNSTKSSETVKPKINITLKRYNCSQCPKTWKTLAELKNHLSSHTNEKPYVCEICGQAYKKQKAFTIHVGMHKGVHPFTCVYCNKSFTQKGALVRHTPIHTGDLPYQCDLCGKRFVHHSSFNVHRLTHGGERTYKCEVCGSMLMSGSHLKRHMKVHTGEKKFSCSTCGKKFAEKYNLSVHEKLHLGISKKRKYQCHVCNGFYNGQVKLEEHLLNVHQKIEFSNHNIQKSHTRVANCPACSI